MNALIDKALESSRISRPEFIEALGLRYREYRQRRLKDERTSIARSVLKEEACATA